MFGQKKKRVEQGDANSEKEIYNRKMLVWIIIILLLFVIACGLLVFIFMDHKGMSNFLQK
jgi:flagellar basal body-associated protein FliL